MDNICQYCEKKFSSKFVLSRHINTSKKCILLRSTNNYQCDNCDFKTDKKTALEYHVRNCLETIRLKDIELETIKRELEYTKELLNRQIEKNIYHTTNNITKNSNTANNTNTINIQMVHEAYKKILSPLEELEEMLPSYMNENFKEQHLNKGVKGLVECTSNLLFGKPKYCITSDPSGRNFYLKTSDGELLKDDNGRFITDLIIGAAEPVANRIGNTKMKDICEQLAVAINDDESRELDKERVNIKNNLNKIREIKNDNKHFRKQIADKGYISKETIIKNLDNPHLIEEDQDTYKYMEKINLLDIVNQKNGKSELQKLSNEMIIFICSSLDHMLDFIINKFLSYNGELIYNYNQSTDKFYYYYIPVNDEEEDSSFILGECDGEIPYDFMNKLSIRFIYQAGCRESFSKLRDIPKDEFVYNLKMKLMLR